jgi:hypothetical protein
MRRALRICGVVIGLTVAAVGGAIAVLAALNPQYARPDASPVAAFGFIALVGAGLAHMSSPGVFQRLARRTASLVRTFSGRLQLSNPEGLAFWTFVICVVLLLVPVIPRPLVVLSGVLVYLLASLVFLLIAPRWWYRLGFTLLAGLIIVVGLVGAAEALEPKSIGEAGLGVFAFWFDSLFVLPAAVLARVLVRAMRGGRDNIEPT